MRLQNDCPVAISASRLIYLSLTMLLTLLICWEWVKRQWAKSWPPAFIVFMVTTSIISHSLWQKRQFKGCSSSLARATSYLFPFAPD